MSSASPHFSRMAPMKVKNGMASNSSFDRIEPNTRPGMACMNGMVK